MRHAKQRNKLSRDTAHRRALLRNLCREVIEHERIKTSQAKAKAVKPKVEKLITLAKRGDLHARRQALSELGQDKFLVHKLFEEVAPRYAERPGRLHADRQARPAAVGLDRDGLPRAGLAAPADGDGPARRSPTTARGFAGWAAQPGQRTVQGELEAALERILGERVALTVAGRTDAGVHALRPGGELRARRASCPTRLAERAERGPAARRRGARAPSPRPTASTPAATPARAPTATGCSPRRSATRSRRAGRCGGAIRSTAPRSTSAPRPSSATTTSPPSPRPRPSTSCSSARC